MQDAKSKLALELWNKLSKAHDIVRKSHIKQMSVHSLTDLYNQPDKLIKFSLIKREETIIF